MKFQHQAQIIVTQVQANATGNSGTADQNGQIMAWVELRDMMELCPRFFGRLETYSTSGKETPSPATAINYRVNEIAKRSSPWPCRASPNGSWQRSDQWHRGI